MRLARTLAFISALLCAWATVIGAEAHDSRPLFVDIKEQSSGVVRVSWKTPPSVGAARAPAISLSAPCTLHSNDAQHSRLNGGALYDCPSGLAGAAVKISYPLYNPSIVTLARVTFAGGEARSAVLEPSQNQWVIPQDETFNGVAKSYFTIGVKHILGGIDHLLFLFGLLYIARTPRRVLVTITGFTIAHSITIFLVALSVIHVSTPAVETIIALSIVFVASEIARNNNQSLTWRRPILVAGGFGLVHGAGFASALAEIGLPQTEKIGALLFFNAGVEAGQLAAIAGAFAVFHLVARFAGPGKFNIDDAPFRRAAGYSLGAISALWFFQRLAAAA